jgi:hypothetical protein
MFSKNPLIIDLITFNFVKIRTYELINSSIIYFTFFNIFLINFIDELFLCGLRYIEN